ncbi:hypothetical protein BMS3Bbin11_00573 [bacterium BMS3Bbin11]|nr:hypothetical protein BMS3Abin11_01379 [bacterium BMS3Abin11]GBE45485.1 hypothetical protein BMS3Bbin11_00573 [bacterium BMS3Bbin11]GMT40349.1 MAG: hypothetical protein IEMM0001_1084 [bacterium]HDH09137.1 DUF4845 domain-containing protein [Gammaproteobacteria bacterium]HDH15977.1 DUF4845 domain-containing protein [Gammaproteobacteria bacterium]
MDNLSNMSKQKGASMWMLILGSALIVLFALVTMKLVPAYLDNNKVAHALDSLKKQPGVGNWSRRQILERVDNTLYIDLASNLLNLNEALVITKTKTKKVISIDYERVVPMAYNISALLDFENSIEVPIE